MGAFEKLMQFQRHTQALGEIAGRLGWDQETMMPAGAAGQRGEEMAAIETVLHARKTDPQIADWMDAIADQNLSPVQQANLRHIRRSFERTTKVPVDLASELARVTSVAQGVWAAARANENFDDFAPTLAQVLDLRRQEAQALAGEGDLYDALLDDYEPGASGAEIEAMFSALRPRLVKLREQIIGSAHAPQALDHEFDTEKQLGLSRELAATFGYDFSQGRIDQAVHPFSSGSGQDVRITTRTSLRDPFNCIYSTIHEVGHACYEQGIDDAYLLTPLGSGVSMGVHESQSRIYENQIGRSQPFCGHLFGRMKDTFGDFGIASPAAFFETVNRVQPGFIRTEADEIHYNLHVMMRFDLERELVAGKLKVPDLPAAWIDRFHTDFGIAVDKPSNGCLQDVHWSVGLFGYFPTYTLGNVYAGCLNKAMRAELPDLDAQLAQGNTAAATGWLRENLQQHGGLYEPRQIITKACGFEPTEAPLLDYLDAKFSRIYRL